MKIVLLLLYLVAANLKNSIAVASADFANGQKSGSILLKSEKHLNITIVDKPSLRYGFQQTRECKDYQLAFTCIRKCLDLGYQIAYADKNCFCNCKHNTNIAKYKPPTFGPTKWKSGAPTTSLPYWVKKHTTAKLSSKDKIPLDNIEIYGDVTIPAEGHTKADKDSNTTSNDIVTDTNTNNTDYNSDAINGNNTDTINGNNTDTNNDNNTDTNNDNNTDTNNGPNTDTNTNTTNVIDIKTNDTNTNSTDTN